MDRLVAPKDRMDLRYAQCFWATNRAICHMTLCIMYYLLSIINDTDFRPTVLKWALFCLSTMQPIEATHPYWLHRAKTFLVLLKFKWPLNPIVSTASHIRQAISRNVFFDNCRLFLIPQSSNINIIQPPQSADKTMSYTETWNAVEKCNINI